MIENSIYNCLDKIIAHNASYFQKDHQLLFINAWDFRAKPDAGNRESLAQAHRILGTFFVEHKFENMRKYHGLEFTLVRLTKDQLITEMRKYLQKQQAVGMYLNSYDCPWSRNYEKDRLPHYTLVVDQRESAEVLVCKDEYSRFQNVNLRYEQIPEGESIELLICEPVPLFTLDDRELKEYLLQHIQSLISTSPGTTGTLMQMEVFFKDFESRFEIAAELVGFETTPFTSPLLNNLFILGSNRGRFSIALAYLAERLNYKEFEEISQHLNQIYNDWMTVYGMCAKLVVMKNNVDLKNRVFDKVHQLVQKEQQSAQQILGILQS